MKQLCSIMVTLVWLLVPMVSFAGHVSAAAIFAGCGDNSANGNTPVVCSEARGGEANPQNPVITLIKIAIDILSFIVGAAAIIGIVVSGLRFILANGEANAISAARSGLVFSLIGVAVVILAQVIVVYVLDKLKI